MYSKQQQENKKYFLKYFDIFGVNPKLYINQKEKYRSSWGGFLTVSLGICVIIACWVYGKDMHYKSKPVTTFTEIANNHPSRYDIKKNNFNFAFGLQNSKRINFIDESIYTLKLQQEIITVKTDELGNSIRKFDHQDIKVRPCQESDFLVDPEFFTSFSGYENLYCIDDYDQVNLHIEGDFGAQYYGNISGKLYPCTNSTESQVVCQPKEVIEQELSENQYTMNFSDQVINPKEYENPFTTVGRNLYGLVSKNEFRQFLMYFRNVYIEDNTGIIFDKISEKRGLQFSNEYELYRSKQKDDGNFFQFVIRFEKSKETKIYRNYLNIAAVIAQVGGILKILMIIFGVLSAYVSKQMFNLQIANSLFKFSDEEQNKEKNIQSFGNLQAEKNKNKNKSQSLEFRSYLRLLFPCCASKKEKQDKKYLNYAVRKMSQKLDIHYILDKLVDIEKIKLLLLDNEQHKLFDYISKPTISNELIEKKQSLKASTILDLDQSEQIAENDKFNNILLLEERSESQKNKQALYAYKKLLRKSNKDVLDEKILNLMDNQMQDIFESKVEKYQVKNNKLQKKNTLILELDQTIQENQNIQQKSQNNTQQQNNKQYQFKKFNTQIPEQINDKIIKNQENDSLNITFVNYQNEHYDKSQTRDFQSKNEIQSNQENYNYDQSLQNLTEDQNNISISINQNQTGRTFFENKIIFPESSYRNSINKEIIQKQQNQQYNP